MKSQYLKRKKIEDEPGVYYFRDYRKRPIYIGRATSLKDRVKSYFANDLIETRGPRLVDMITKARTLTWQKTSSVLEAILLESALIKRYQPYYNVAERDDKSDQYVIITDEPWPRVFLERARDFEKGRAGGSLTYKAKYVHGPFLESALIKEALKILRRLFPFRDRKAHDPRHERFYQAIGQSPLGSTHDSARQFSDGGRANGDSRLKYLKNIRYLNLFFQGQSKRVRTLIERDMKRNAKSMNFETAAENRKLLNALTHINDIALIKSNSNNLYEFNANQDGRSNGPAIFGGSQKSNQSSRISSDYRIEAYDIAHLSGTNVVGVMTVMINGELAKEEYRRFKISKEQNNDTANLTEMLFRRLNHPEWAYPDMIVVDGNDAQKNAAEAVLRARRIEIPVIAVTKDDKHKAAQLLGSPELISGRRQQIIAINAEAHRFAIRYHRTRRKIIYIH